MTRGAGDSRGQRGPILPERVRRVEGGFSFVPNRFLHGGFFASLSCGERSLYLFLVLAGDRNGVSYYSYERICSVLEITPDEYVALRNGLLSKDLVAFDGRRFQVLSLPSRPQLRRGRVLSTREELLEEDPATIRQEILRSLSESREGPGSSS